MSLHQRWLEEPYQAAQQRLRRWECFCDMHECDLRDELRAEPDEYMREDLGEWVDQHLELWMGDRRAFMLGMQEQYEEALERSVKRALEEKYRGVA